MADRAQFDISLTQLRKIVRAMFPRFSDFKKEWKRYRAMFQECFVHAKASKATLQAVNNLFNVPENWDIELSTK